MNLMNLKLAGASTLALVLAAGPVAAQETAPATGQEPLGQTGTAGDAGVIEEGTATDTAAADPIGDRLGIEEFETLLGDIGIEERELFFGSVLRGEADDAQVVMFIGPEDFARGEGDEAAMPDTVALESQLAEAGFENIQQDLDWLVMQGDWDGHAVLALAAQPMPGAVAGIEGEEAQAEGDIDRETLRERLAEGDIDASDDELDLRLFKATSETGDPIFFVIGPEAFEAGSSLDLDADDMREAFEEAGLSDVEEIDEDDFAAVRAEAEDGAIVAVAGDVLTAETAAN